MILIFSLLWMIVGGALLFALKYLFGIDGTSFSMFFIVPIGAIIAGYIMTVGFPVGMKKGNIKSSKVSKLVSVLLAIALFVGIQYGYYQMTYIGEDITFNYKFQGDHISEYYFDDSGEQVNFFNYTVDRVNSMTISFSRNYVREIGSVEGNKTINWLFFGIDLLGFLLGAYLAYSTTLDDLIYCDSCRKYKKNSTIGMISEAHDDNLQSLIDAIEQKDKELAHSILKAHPVKEDDAHQEYLKLDYHECDECQSSNVVVTKHTKNEKGKFSKDNSYEKKIDMPRVMVFDV